MPQRYNILILDFVQLYFTFAFVMEFVNKAPFVENWVLLFLMIQFLIVGAANLRTEGRFLYSLAYLGKNVSFRARNELDRISSVLLHINTLIGFALFGSLMLCKNFYLNTALFSAMVFSILIYLVWHLDYLFLKLFISSLDVKSLQRKGNVAWIVLGVFTLGLNLLLIFHNTILLVSWALGALSFMALCYRIIRLLPELNGRQISWVYFILYLCTVYVIPSVLLSKYYESQWLELLTP